MTEERKPSPTDGRDAPGRQLARTLGGALARVVRAVPDYLGGERRSGSRSGRSHADEDTGEWPAPGT